MMFDLTINKQNKIKNDTKFQSDIRIRPNSSYFYLDFLIYKFELLENDISWE